MRAYIGHSKERIAEQVAVAETPFSRMRGLLGRGSFPKGNGLLIRPCKGVHTFGMKFSIDIVFLDSESRVLAMKKNMPPNRMSRLYCAAESVLELPAGTLDDVRVMVGDRVVLDGR